MNKLLKLTIAIPTYNRSSYLDKNLSILYEEQKQSNFGILISNNGSNDDTINVINKWQNKLKNIQTNHFLKNKGWTHNFNYCLKETDTEYVILLGDDDFIEKGFLKQITSYIDKKHVDLIFLKSYNNEKKSNFKSNRIISPIKLNSFDFIETIFLKMRLISCYIINTKFINPKEKMEGNFAHLNIIYKAINSGNNLIYLEDEIIGCTVNNSSFLKENDFSDIYIDEFWNQFNKYFDKKFSKDQIRKLKFKMLFRYYPKLLLKSIIGKIKFSQNLIFNLRKHYSFDKLY